MGLSRVWIEDGCILCNLCVEISPESFVLEDEHCYVRSEADLDEHEEEIRQAALDCPVAVIRVEEE
jgi:ferredoxin